MPLDRFHRAQSNRTAGYVAALTEIRQGQKTSHWIWYIFPQLVGLGRSASARSFALADLTEACAYLDDETLRGRYLEAAEAVRQQLAAGVLLEKLMGSGLDALKLVSSITLFREAATKMAATDERFGPAASICEQLLAAVAQQGYPPCSWTLASTKGSSAGSQGDRR